MADTELDQLSMYRRGQKDAREKGEPDWSFLGTINDSDIERPYFQGYESVIPDFVPQGDRPVEVPECLEGLISSESFTLEVQRVLDSSSDLIDPPKPSDVSSDDVEEALRAVLREASDDEFRIYRTMDVPEDWFREVGPETDFGKHWSVVENHTIGHHGFNTHQALICADAPFSAVDWPETVACWLNNVENEVRLLEGASVQLQWVMKSVGGEAWQEVDIAAARHPS